MLRRVGGADIGHGKELFLVRKEDAPRRAVEDSRHYLLDGFGQPEPGWLTASG